MLRLIFEAVMVIAVVSCLFFMMKLGQMDNSSDGSSSDESDEA